MNLKKNKLILYAAVVGFLGFLDATYLTILHYKQTIPPCTIGNCETVLNSQFSTVFGIPLALLGSGFYLSVIILSLLILTGSKKIFLNLFYILAFWGFIFSLLLIGVQAFILNAFCQYCLISAATSTGVFILAILQFRKNKSAKESLI